MWPNRASTKNGRYRLGTIRLYKPEQSKELTFLTGNEVHEIN